MADEDLLTAFRDSVARGIARRWPGPTTAADGDVAMLWDAAEDGGWPDVPGWEDPSWLVVLSRSLGRAAAPLPVVDTVLARALLHANDADLDVGTRVVLVVVDGGDAPSGPVEGAASATHLLAVPRAGGAARLWRLDGADPVDGLPRPAWALPRLGGIAVEADIDAAAADRAVVLARLCLGARALAAAGRTHEMAVAHAIDRQQFGRPIGSFGAVQQRAAACQIDLRAGELLIDGAVRRAVSGHRGWETDAELASEHVVGAARRIQLGAHHTLAAVGYFEEHDAPWLFRRVHADVAALLATRRAGGSVADVLVETDAPMPPVDVGPGADDFRREVVALLEDTGRLLGRALSPPDDPDFVTELSARGWLGMGWPVEAGGRGAGLAEQVVLDQELTYHRAPARKAVGAVTLLGTAILRHGSDEQRARFLPLIRAGRMDFCLGYSEPEAGSDLASLRTRAERDGDGWVINGQKLWTTDGHVAEWVWLATRTDPDAPKREGITIFLVPMSTEGISVTPHRALSGEVSCTVSYDDVRVGDHARVGEVNGGWRVIRDALMAERVLMGGIAAALHRQLDDLLAAVRVDPERLVGPRGSVRRARLAEVAVAVQASRMLVAHSVSAMSAGTGGLLEAPMAAVLGGETAEAFGETMIDVLGPDALLAHGVPGDGAFEASLRLAPMYVIGGGTNDIQRGLIARGLGLPR